ncbi:hypothetical protein GH714_013144 [Hevea brasiliensis]|uniref:Uncharacterized protein n=1 Tax=Hevea brasiliensis TaxID=3981 RepID=A0A6A6M028_HEVBR|nr:hypothetical protein GH714_013144 [Hevea brasiliensis]
MCRKDSGDLCGGYAVYDSSGGIFSSRSVDEYKRICKAHCSKYWQGEEGWNFAWTFCFGRNKHLFRLVFPSWSTPILESVASIGLLFYLFLVGLELDFSSIRQSGKRAFGIAIAGISLPFLFGIALSFFLRKAVHGEDKVGYGQYLLFMGVALSITAFPVLARILAELKLLTTQVGQTAMAAAAFNDVAAWILLALAVALAGNGSTGDSRSPLISLWVLISGVAFVAFMLVFVRPMMNWVAKKCSQPQDFLDEACICVTLAGVMLSGFMSDLIGIHAIFGAFVFGLTIPKEGEFARRLIIRIEDFVSGLLLPLYFASSGLKTDVTKIRGVEAWGVLVLVVSTACAGKILGTFVVAMLCMIPARESLALGVLMNTKGLVELIVLNIGKEKKILNDEMFAILVLMAIFTSLMTTPTVMAIYKPSRRACQAERQSPSDENSHGTSKDQIEAAFEAYGHATPLTIRHSTSISALSTMHEDICHVAEDKRVAMIILPFHKQWREGEEDEDVGLKWREWHGSEAYDGTDQEVGTATTIYRRVCILFLGGPDDRKALEVGARMAEHPAITVTLIRFQVQAGLESRNSSNNFRDKEMDEVAVEELRRKCNGSVKYVEKDVNNVSEEVLNIGQSRAFDLFIVGREVSVAKLADNQAEHPELGLIGDILASSHNGMARSVLVIQQKPPTCQ